MKKAIGFKMSGGIKDMMKAKRKIKRSKTNRKGNNEN